MRLSTCSESSNLIVYVPNLQEYDSVKEKKERFNKTVNISSLKMIDVNTLHRHVLVSEWIENATYKESYESGLLRFLSSYSQSLEYWTMEDVCIVQFFFHLE